MLSSGMLIGGVWVGLTYSSKILAGSSGRFGARVAQAIIFGAMGLFLLPYFLTLFQS